MSIVESFQIAAWHIQISWHFQKETKHAIAEEFVKPVAKLRTNMLLGKKKEQVIGKITLWDNFTECHIIWTADNVIKKLLCESSGW